MTEIRLDSKALEVWVHGHAGSAPEGEDLVCAGVSTLVWSLIKNWKAAQKSGAVKRLEWKYEKGEAHVRVRPAAGMRDVCTVMMSGIVSGFCWLAETYPQYVTLKKM